MNITISTHIWVDSLGPPRMQGTMVEATTTADGQRLTGRVYVADHPQQEQHIRQAAHRALDMILHGIKDDN